MCVGENKKQSMGIEMLTLVLNINSHPVCVEIYLPFSKISSRSEKVDTHLLIKGVTFKYYPVAFKFNLSPSNISLPP